MNAQRKRQIQRCARTIRRETQALLRNELPLAAALNTVARIQGLIANITSTAHAEFEEEEGRLRVLTEVESSRQGAIVESVHYIDEALDDLKSDLSLAGVLTAVEELQRHTRDITEQVLEDYDEGNTD